MARRTTFAPDVTLGELLVLVQIASLKRSRPGVNATAEIASKLGRSEDSVRNAIARVSAALGPIEVSKGERRSMEPSVTGDNIGRIGWIADALIKIATKPDTDPQMMRDYLDAIRDDVVLRGDDCSLSFRTPHT